MAVFIMAAATLADLQGRRRWYLAGITVFTLASVGCAVLGSVLAAWLSAKLDRKLAPVVPEAAERRVIAAAARCARPSARKPGLRSPGNDGPRAFTGSESGPYDVAEG